MDKGFYSKRNIDYILNKFPSYKFLIALPFTTDLTRKIVANGIANFDKSLYFKIGKDNLLGYSFYKSFDLSHNLKYHVFFNNKLYNERYNKLINDAILLRQNALKDPQHYKNIKDYKKYLNFKTNKSNDSIDITINHDRIEFDLKNSGWLIIVGNDLDISYENVCHIYRSKDCVEKEFDRLKGNLDLSRLRVHDDTKANNKMFISFISLIILSYIHNVMAKNNLYRFFTLVELIESLGKIKLHKAEEKTSISPISKTNRMILNYFNIKITQL
jgi:transposase